MAGRSVVVLALLMTNGHFFEFVRENPKRMKSKMDLGGQDQSGLEDNSPVSVRVQNTRLKSFYDSSFSRKIVF